MTLKSVQYQMFINKILRGQNQKKNKKVSLKKLERTQRIRSEGLERVAYDSKSIEKFGVL